MIVLASVFSVIYKSDPQGRDYFKPFIASLEGGNATAFPTLADDYGPNTGTAVETQGARPPEPLPALRSMAREATREGKTCPIHGASPASKQATRPDNCHIR
eukprot:8195854-Pyramimonas_sp.AAC.1